MAHIDELLREEADLWDDARRRGQDGPRVLLATSMGDSTTAP
ncbi:MAG: hypothetical protein WDM92_06165 [Caulobacteraceae bacterium]